MSQRVVLKETDLFNPVKDLFESQGYTVYSEVNGPSGRADVVAVHGAELVVVELKTTLSLELMEQAQGWIYYAHKVYVAVPKQKRHNNFARFLLKKLGIGLIEVNFSDPRWSHLVKAKPEAQPDSWTPPQWNRKISDRLRKALREEQRQGPPGGTAGGGYVTEYKLTMERIRKYLRYDVGQGQWASIKDILEHCHTHYAAPKQSLAKALLSFETDWCEVQKIKGAWHFRLKESAASVKGQCLQETPKRSVRV